MLDAYGVEMIGANVEAIRTAEDRQRFKAAMTEIGLRVPPSGVAYTLDEALAVADEVGYPRHRAPGVHPRRRRHRHRARSPTRCSAIAERGLAASPISEILIERSVVGWKEYELEVMRDHADNVVVICSIENLDPMGVHTGESITVAPAQTLTDVEYQRMRDAAFACIRRIGVETGGSNVQFAVDPRTGEMVIIEMNPRVSRSSRAREQGHRLPDREDRGQARGRLPPRRGPQRHHAGDAGDVRADDRLRRHEDPALGVREAARARSRCSARRCSRSARSMAIGRTFCESLQKAVRSLETGRLGLNCDPAEHELDALDDDELVLATAVPTPEPHLPARGRAAPVRLDRAPARGHRHRSVVPRPDPADRRGTRPARRTSASTR